eukprot:4077223-Pleurochrysis_carterae.AAC.1
MEEEGKTADEAETAMAQLRVEQAAETAKLVAKIEILEAQVAKAAEERDAQFVRGWNACETK